jgi:outer membrane protein assembly factor BamB
VPGNPYAQPVPPGQNPYAQAPTYPNQGAFPQQMPPYGGAPQPPYPGAPGMPPGGTRGSRGKVAGIVAAVAGVLVIGGGVFLATSGGGGDGPKKMDPSAGTGGGKQQVIEAKALWNNAGTRPPKAEITAPIPEAWFTGDTAVKILPDSVRSFDIASGKENWSIPLSGETCPGSRESANDRIVVMYGADCGQVMAIDIAKGRQLWHKNLPSTQSSGYSYGQIALSGDTAAVAWLGGSAGYKISTGAQIWAPKAGADCEDKGYKGGAQLVAIVQCGGYGGDLYVQALDASGAKKWNWQVPAGAEVNTVVSTDPVVVGLAAGDSLLSDLVYIDNGRLKTKISLGAGGADATYGIDCNVNGEGHCHNFAVDPATKTIYLPTKLHAPSGSGYERTNEIAALDLTTGKPEFLAKPDVEREVHIVGIDEGGQVIGYQKNTYDKPGRLIALDPKTHKVTPYMELPSSGISLENRFLDTSSYQWLYKRHFFVTSASISATGSLPDTAIAAFG